MCGIAGILERDGRPVDLAELSAMTARLAHRGPDDSGCFVSGPVGLGNRRLSIIDLAGGHQPMANEDGTVHVVQNGEIYNFPELRAVLSGRGARFRTSSDTEVILRVYEAYGVAGLARLRGIFALAIWDAPRRRLVLARDHVGIKPLYYRLDDRRLLFASEIRGLLAAGDVPRRLSLPAMDRFLSFYYVPGEETIFDGIRRLPPAHIMVCENGNVEIRPYWRPVVAPRPEQPEAAWEEELRVRLFASVRRQMVADVPVGVFLSGGLDSSAIVAMLAAAGRKDTPTFSVGFTKGARYFDEVADAERVARHFGMDHRVIQVEPDVAGLLPTVVDSLEEPMGGPTTFLTYLISEAARQHVKVALAGVGGDELFGGYRRYAGALWSPRLHHLPAGARAALRRGLGLLPATDETRLGYHLNTFRRLLDAAGSEHPDAYISMVSYFTPAMKRRLYTPDVSDALGSLDAAAEFREHFARPRSADLLGRIFHLDLMTYLPDDLLLFTDKMSMARSLEVRVPLLDVELVEFAATLPQSLRIRSGRLKYLFRKAMTPLLPRTVLSKPKQGFSAPVGEWLRHELRGYAEDLLAPSVVRARGLWEPSYVSELLTAHQQRVRDHGHHLFALMMFELWCRRFLDGAEADARTAGVCTTAAMNGTAAMVTTP